MEFTSDDFIRTRTTLINRLKDWQDQSSWQDFFDTYWKLIFGVAVQSGLTETESQDVVQETMFSIAKQMPDFNYDRTQGSFSAWLLKMTRWRIRDQFRKRGLIRTGPLHPDDRDRPNDGDPMDAIADPTPVNLDELWEREWKRHLVEAAIATVKRSVDPQQFQIFDMYVNKHWTPERVASAFGVSVSNVYMAKHRVTTSVKKEVERIAKVRN